ncbi:S1C family serine protease [Roseibacillus ishigakijimensis]|uniref:PDZ domain-containing protein n=1 Tax=Roseibacillus ishigakijimensis TaxID=454146 RepID=A0A934RPE2_9BACT|nr:S1C family serine protease [Roseibacillus ishigakijimensis]MBK1833397.1 PDZ domain-containing protein [Roseibacillus ishigakijimensis]
MGRKEMESKLESKRVQNGLRGVVLALAWCLGTMVALGEQEALQEGVVFKKKGSSGDTLQSEVVFLDEAGLAVVATEATTDFRSGTYRGEPVSLVAHDSVSRLTLVRVPLASGEATAPVELGSSLKVEEGSAFYLGVEGESSISRFVSRESEYKGQPLPLELFRVHHAPEVKPGLGHPFFDSAGRLVAINYRKASEFGNGSFAFPVEVLKRIQGASVENGVVQRSWFGVELLPSNPLAVVEGVRPSSPAAKAGLIEGDILIRIGPRFVQDYFDALNAFFYLREGEEATVTYVRGTEVGQTTVLPELAPVALPAGEGSQAAKVLPGAAE